jgi:hypothetical protein
MTNQRTTLNTYKVDCTGCKACAADYQADNLRHAIARMTGISDVKVDEITEAGCISVVVNSALLLLNKPKAFANSAQGDVSKGGYLH